MYYIYKLTNLITNKVYIGKTTQTLEQRLNEHAIYASDENHKTHLANSIRKHGIENFKIESIDTANTEEELDRKEKFWIKKYNSVLEGYNLTDGGEGGNTYKYKTEAEMLEIKNKLSLAKKYDKNPNATKVKCRNEKTKEEYHFNTLIEMQEFFNETNHNFITKRCLGQTKCLYKQIWNIAYENQDYVNLSSNKNNARAKRIKVEDLKTKEIKEFASYAEAERHFNLPLKTFSGKAYRHKDKEYFISQNRYKIFVLN